MTYSLNVLLALGLVASCGEIKPSDLSSDGGEDQGITLSRVSPSGGPISGGTAVTLLGSGFVKGETEVLLGGRRIPDVEVIDEQTLVLRTLPADAVGPVEVRAFNANGFGSLADAFTYAQVTTLQRLQPAIGPASGGNTVTVTGSGFEDGQPGVTLLSLSGVNLPIEIVDDSTLTFIAPPGPLFTAHDLRIENRNGNAELPQSYGYAKAGLLGADARNVQQSRLYFIDPTTAEATVLRTLPRSVSGLLARTDGTLLAATGFPTPSIAKIGLFDNTVVDVVSMASQLPDLTETPDGKILAFFRQQRTSVLIDIDAAEPSLAQGPVLTTNGINGCGIATLSGGKLVFGGQGTGGFLQTIVGDTLADDLQLVDASSATIMALTFYDGKLYGIRKGGSGTTVAPGGSPNGATLITINLVTGAITEIGALPPSLDALTFVPGLE